MQPLRQATRMERIVAVVAERLGCKADEWTSGRGSMRSAARLPRTGRRRYGYSSTEIAEVFGYRGPSSVGAAVPRIEAAGKDVVATLANLQEQFTNG